MAYHFRRWLILLVLGSAPATIAASGDIVTEELNRIRGAGTSDAVIHLDQDQAVFEATMATELGNGNKLVDVEVLTTTGPVTKFSGVFYPVSGTIHTLIHGTEAEWTAFLNTVDSRTGRWLDLEVGFHLLLERRYSGIFLEDGSDYSFLVDSNMTDAELQTIMENQLRAGLSMIDFEAYPRAGSGDTAFGAIWVKDPNQPMTHLYYDLELGDLEDLWSPLAGRIIDLERYHSTFFNEERFAIVVANHPGDEQYVDTWMTEAEVGTTNASVSDADTHLIDLHVFDDGGNVRYSGVWGASWKSLNEVAELTPFVNHLALTSDLNTLIQDFEVNKPHGEGIIGFYAKNLRTQQAVGYRKDEPFYLGSATKTAAHIRYWMQLEAGHFAPDDQDTELLFSLHSETGAPWYVEDRGSPGFSSGSPGHVNALGQPYTLDRFDRAMMEASDNAATSALIDDPGIGLANDPLNLNEWLSSVDGVGQGWGLVTSINDLDRLIHWHGQHTTARKNDPSFFLAPSHTFGPFQRNDYKACTVVGSTPIACVPASSCTRCNDDSDCTSPEFCVSVRDPWTDLATHMGLAIGALPPNPDWTVGYERYYAMGLNSATPRAYSNLLEKFWKGDFLADNTPALDNMLEDSQLNDDFPCRVDANSNANCAAGEGWKTWAAKGGSKGRVSDGTSVCVDTAIFEMTGGGGSDVVTMTIMMRENSTECGISGLDNDLRNYWDGPFGDAMMRAVTVDLEPRGTISPTFILRGGQFDLTLDVDNVGGAVSGSFTVRIFASENQDATGGWYVDEVFVPSVAGNSTYSAGIVPVDLSTSMPEGEYWIYATVDSLGEVGEYDETPTSNIERLTGGKLYIVPPCADDDGDGFSTCNPLCIPDGTICGDCDPTDPTIYPGAPEICNGIDDDCDTIVDNIPTPLVARRVEHDDPLPYEHFGQSLANLGDLDGDGIDDFVVGAPGQDVAGVGDAGIARVISGADLTTICDAFLPAPSTSDDLGESVAAAAGDLNANGQPDFVVGVPFHDGAAIHTGAVAVFNGPDCALIRLMEDPAMVASDRLGHSVASIGDVDGDTVPDIAAGSLYSSLSGSAGGAISLFSGATGNVLFTMFDPTALADDLGDTLAGPGDLTGDGIPDIAAGAPETDVSGSSNGAVYIFSGADGTYFDRFTDPTSESFARLGESLAALGDLGSDGISEIAAGQNGDIVGGSRVGSVAIFEGSSGVVIQRLINPIGAGGSAELFPTAVAPIADMNGDGVTDVIVGADGDDDLASNAGSVFVFDSVTGAVLHHLFDPAGAASDQLGTQVISLGDISGDGLPDFAASAPSAANIEGREAGHVVVFVMEEDCDGDGYTPYSGDCNDDDPAFSPDASEVCDTLDNDCDGDVDEDNDGDGFDVCNDCNDRNPRVNPDGIEICNQIDDNCSGIRDEDPDGTDDDGDGNWGACSDCDDTNPDINWSAEDTCNHIDDDCSGIADDAFPMVVSTRFSMLPSGEDNDELATDVAAIGDVNNDGIADFVAGSPLADIGGTNQGAAVVFDGATGAMICIATPGTQNSEQAGASVAGVGDVNGDGAADFAMGAPFHDWIVADVGKIYVINGDDCTLIRELVDSSGTVSDRLGLSVAGIGDLTGDGIGEIAGGAPWAQTPQGNQAGAVLVWNGATGTELFKLTDTHTGSNFAGTSVAGIDDVNADGVPDILAGAPFDDGVLGGDVGSVLVFSGLDGSLIHKIFDPDGTGSDQLGTDVAGIADLTGDHVPDILAGAIREDSGGSDNGAILVFSGADGTLAQRVPLTDTATSRHFGSSVAALGDLNGDLIPEFAGGAPDDDTEEMNAGRVLVINGADFSVLYDLTLPGSSLESNLGFALDGIDDLNGDGTPELLVAQPRHDTQEDRDVGRVVVFSFESDCDSDGVGPFEYDCDDQNGSRYPGLIEVCDGIDNDCDVAIDEDEDGDGDDACADCAPAIPTISTTMTEVCNTIDDNCNTQIDEGVDLDGDSYTTPCDCDDDDVNVNASIAEACNTIDDNCDGRIDEGFATPLNQVRILDPEPAAGDDMGVSIAIVGDVDSDATPDIVIGVPGDNTTANGAGSAILVSGATRGLICRLVDPGGLIADALGHSVAGVGDVTGDGTPDIAVGAPHDDSAGASSGAVQIFSGATCAWVRELSDPGGEAADLFGTSIASIGDVTGDAVPDIAVGANDDHENGYSDVGSVSVFNGATGAFLYKAVDPHGRSNDQLGISVSALGDVDFDGIPDFIAGALVDNIANRGGAGSVNVFSGADGSFLRSIVDPTATANEYLGRSVAAAGDMNGDGVADLIAGAEGDDSGATNSGAVLAFSGSDGSLIRRFVDSSPLQSADLGAAVAAAGDLNGDGITEVVAGAPDSSRTGNSAGEVVVFDGATGVVLHRFTDVSSLAGDDLGASLAVADTTGGGGIEILAGAPNGDPGGINTAGYLTVFTLDADCDGDGFSPLVDCDDTNGGTQGEPSAAQALLFGDKTTLNWTAPSDPGLSAGTLVYDVVRSSDPSDFTTAATCVETDDGADTTAVAPDTPAPGAVFAYLVRAQSLCGEAVAMDSTPADRNVAQCP